MNADLHYTSRADGSCFLKQSGTVYLATVHGPHLCPTAKRDYHQLSISYAFRNKERHEHNYKNEFIMRAVLDHAIDKQLFPRQVLNCNVQEIEAVPGNASPAVNAACMALLDAAVPLNHIFCGVNVNIRSDEENKASDAPLCSFTFVFKPSDTTSGDLIASSNHGVFTMEQYEQVYNEAQKYCLPIFDFYRETLGQQFTAKLSYGMSEKPNRKQMISNSH